MGGGKWQAGPRGVHRLGLVSLEPGLAQHAPLSDHYPYSIPPAHLPSSFFSFPPSSLSKKFTHPFPHPPIPSKSLFKIILCRKLWARNFWWIGKDSVRQRNVLYLRMSNFKKRYLRANKSLKEDNCLKHEQDVTVEIKRQACVGGEK